MIECPICGADTDESLRFCMACGSQLVGGPPTQSAAAAGQAEGDSTASHEYPAAGWCDTCQGFVWVDADWACQYGHPRSVVSRWYDPRNGDRLSPPWREQLVNPEGETGVTPELHQSTVPPPHAESAQGSGEEAPGRQDQGPGSRLALLAHIREALNISRFFVAEYGEDTDLVISSVASKDLEEHGLANVEYSAILKADEREKKAHFWETLKESSGGLAFGGIETDLHTLDDIVSTTEEAGGLLPGHEDLVSSDSRFDYRSTREMLAGICRQHGWELEVALGRQGATR